MTGELSRKGLTVSKHRGHAGPLAPHPFRRTSAPKHRRPASHRGRRIATPIALVVVGGLSVGLSSDTVSGADVQQAAGAVDQGLSKSDLKALRDRGLDRADRSATRKVLEGDLQKVEEIRIEQRVAREKERARKAAEARRAAIAAARAWRAPLSGYRISSPFGEYSYIRSGMHTGLDLSAPEGTPVNAVAAGKVVSAAYDGSFGNKVVVQHSDGTETWYCHLSAIAVSVGQTVGNTTQVGNVGSTGNVTGPHLHLEVHPGGGDPVDPMAWMAAHGVQL